MKVITALKEYSKLIVEGDSWKDKLSLTYYFLKMPIRIFYRMVGHDFPHYLNREVIISNKEGKFFCGKSIFAAWTSSSFYEPELRDYFSLKEGTFIDIGANIGKYSVIVGKQLKERGTVVSFEPEIKNFLILEKNIELNNLKNILPIRKGLFSKKGKLRFYLDGEEEGNGAHSLIKRTNKFIEIEVDTLDNIVLKNKIKNIRLIKIDVEGAEADVLIGANKTLKKYHPKILLEAWNDECFRKIRIVLDKNHYKYKKIGTQDYLAY